MPRAAGKPARKKAKAAPKKAKAAPKKAKAAPKKAKAAPKAVPKAKETVESLFERFCSAQDDSSAAGVEGQTRIGPEGIEAWTGALGVEPSDRRVLLFCWHARAAQMGYFTKEEWSRGFAASHAKTMAGLKRGLKTLDRTVEDPDDFEEFFEYAFDYCLTEPGQKILDKDTAAAMLQVVMPADEPHLAPFVEFLAEQREYKVVNRDMWAGFLRFCQEMDVECEEYDETSCWPSILDSFVEWKQEKSKQ